MYHQKGFASLTGGLRAADKAQNAETTATTVQMVSVLFSVAIAVLLTMRRQHLAAAGDLCADVSGGMERPEHRRVRPETA